MTNYIVILLNQEFISGYQALIRSILHCTPNFNTPILCYDIDLNDYNRDHCKIFYNNIEFIELDKSPYQNLPKHSPNLTNAFYKLELFKLASQIPGILYIDCDIIFVDNINELLNFDIPKEYHVSMRFHGKYKYYNSGLILFNHLNIDVYHKLIHTMSRMPTAHLADQSVIEKAVNKQILQVFDLPKKWNTTKREIVRNEVIEYSTIHYVGKKPWKGGEGGQYENLEELWWKNYEI